MGILGRFLTFKTSDSLDREAMEKAQKKRIIETPHGLRSQFSEERARLDNAQAKSDKFLKDIEDHFGADAKYLTPAYTGRSKFENIEGYDDRRIGMSWVSRIAGTTEFTTITVSFAYTESRSGVRLDYIMTRVTEGHAVMQMDGSYKGRAIETLNEEYDGSRDNAKKKLNIREDDFRTVVRYVNHADFAHSGDSPPAWFIDMLAKHAPRTPR